MLTLSTQRQNLKSHARRYRLSYLYSKLIKFSNIKGKVLNVCLADTVQGAVSEHAKGRNRS